MIEAEEIAEHFIKALNGEIHISLLDGITWDEAYCGNVGFKIGDWEVVFFNDCCELDYTDSVKLPDGREAEFDDWCTTEHIGCPLDLLTQEQYEAFANLLETTN